MVPVHFFAKVFNVRLGEGRIVIALLLHSFFLGIGITYFFSAASALFLIKFGAETLPYVYIGLAIVAPTTGLLFSKLEQKLSITKLFAITLGFLFVSICIFRLVLDITDFRWPFFLFYVWANVFVVLCHLEFWGLAGRCFNVRQGKRLFGLIGAGEVLAYIIGGLTVPAIVEWLGTLNLLVCSATGIGFSLVILAFIYRLFPDRFEQDDQKEEKHEKHEEGEVQGFRYFLKNRYTTLIFILWTVSVFSYYFIDFAFYQLVEIRYTSEDQVAGFFGVFFAVAGTADLLSRMFVSGPLLSRFGLTAGLLALPIALMLGSVAMIVGYFVAGVGILFWLVVMTRIFDRVFRSSIEEPSKRILYQPIPIDKRLNFQTSVEGFIEPIAGGLAGAGLLLLTNLMDFKSIHAASFLICIGAVWIGVVVILHNEYKKALLEALSKRTLGDVKIAMIDASSVEVLKKGLNHSNPGVIAYCLNMLQEMEHPQLDKYLIDLLDSPHWQIRLEALKRIESLKFHSALEKVRKRVEEEEVTKIKGMALRVLYALEENFSYEKVVSYLEHPNPNIREGVIVGLLRSGGVEETRFAGNHIMESIRSPHWEERRIAVQFLGEAEATGFHEQLFQLMHDENIEVRKASLEAGGKLKASQLWPGVLEGLENSQTRAAAFSALVSGGEPVLPLLKERFKERNSNHQFMVSISRICGQIGGESALEILASNLAFPAEEVRGQIFHSLAKFNYQAPLEKKEEIIEAIHHEARNATWALAALVEIDGQDHSSVLKRALNQSFLGQREKILLLLSFIHPSRDILRIRIDLSSPSVNQRAYALEALDHIIPQNIKGVVFPLMDELQPVEGLKQLNQRFPQENLNYEERLAKIISRPLEYTSPWTIACALYLAGKTDTFNHYDVIIDLLSSQIPVVRETAAWALYSLDEELFNKYLSPIKANCDFVANHLLEKTIKGEREMILTVEKTIILHETEIFSETPEELLVNIASVLKEIEINEEKTIIQKGGMGSSMFIIFEGKVRVHDGDHTIATLGPGQVFGELSVLDPEPRMASVTALENTRLFKIEQDVFYEILSEHINVAKGIMRVLCQRLRNK